VIENITDDPIPCMVSEISQYFDTIKEWFIKILDIAL